MDIYIERLQKHYGSMPILNIRDLSIEGGKITGILGQNGTGKSTLLGILAGLDNDFEGRVLYGGAERNAVIERQLTLVFQKPMLLKRSVYENIAYPLRVRKWGKSDIDSRVQELLAHFGIEHLKSRNATALSGGESQKVALARAMSFLPEVLFLDEPFSSVDVDAIPMMEELILDYSKTAGKTVVIVTHSLSQAANLCDRKLILHRQREGSRYEILKDENIGRSTTVD